MKAKKVNDKIPIEISYYANFIRENQLLNDVIEMIRQGERPDNIVDHIKTRHAELVIKKL